MMKITIVVLALAVIASASLVDVIPHNSHHGNGHGISSRYFRKAQGLGLGYGNIGYASYDLGYGGYGLGYRGYGLGYGANGLGYGGLGFDAGFGYGNYY